MKKVNPWWLSDTEKNQPKNGVKALKVK